MKHNTELGQHFMHDRVLLKKIIHIADIGTGTILEIGSGDGALTTVIRETSTNIITVDIDERFEADYHGNILELIDQLSFDCIIANLPYHISEPLFIKLTSLLPKSITVVVGDAFAKHLQEETILGTVFRDIYKVTYVQEISPESFTPPPRVLSALIHCTLKEEQGALADFYAYPKSKVKNYLKTKTTKRGAQEFINKLPLPLIERRLYELSTDEFLQMASVVRDI